MEDDIIKAFKIFTEEFKAALIKFEASQHNSGYAIVITNQLRIEELGNEVWKQTQHNTVTINGHILGLMHPISKRRGFIPV